MNVTNDGAPAQLAALKPLLATAWQSRARRAVREPVIIHDDGEAVEPD